MAVRRDGLPDIDWCKVEVEGSSSVEVEIEGHGKVKMDLPFYIARYPVTYVQFQAFIDAPDGYHNGEIDWFGRLVRQKHQRELAEQRFKFPNHPRENVNWYQAIGFCRWLSWRLERLRCSRSDAGVRVRMSRSKLGSGKFDLMNPFSWMVRLPTEAEWQFAAAGPSAQTYPWGNSFDSRFANTYESGLGRSTAVGMYPAGAAACGALDLSGNAWEWTLTDYYYTVGMDSRAYRHGENEMTSSARAVRGGSWRDMQVKAQTANRHHGAVANRGVATGFRLVGRPFP